MMRTYAEALANIIIMFGETPEEFGALMDMHRARVVALAVAVKELGIEEETRMIDKMSFVDRHERSRSEP